MRGASQLEGIFQITLHALKAIPDPIVSIIVGSITAIWEAVDSAKQNRHQIQLLFERICIILQSLKLPREYSDEALVNSIKLLQGNLQSILTFIVNEQKKSFLKSVLTADDLKFKIEEQERLIWTACFAFQNAALVAQDVKLHDLWDLLDKQRKETATADSQQQAYLRDISDKLDTMRSATANTQFLDALLDTFNADPVKQITAMRVVLDRDDSGMDSAIKLSRDERAFFKAGVARLTAQTSEVKIKSWTVTSFEVERGFLLGSDVTSRVRVGRWLGRLVGIVEMKDAETVHRIIKAWKGLRSPLIQTFLGASTVDNPPFILVPHNSDNIVEYVSKQNEAPNYVRLAHDVIRGLEYLHTRQPPVIHGNLRPAVVHVDAQGRAAITCVGLYAADFSISTEEMNELERELDTWRAPELLAGGSCTESSDVYAWGRLLRTLIEHLGAFHRSPPFDGRKLLERLCESAMSADPSTRPTASQIVELLLGISSVAPIEGHALFLPHGTMEDGTMADPAMDRWRVVPCSREQYGEIDTDDDIVYLQTQPISGRGEHPLRQLSFEIRCHDQGEEYTSADPRDGTWTWIEVAVLRPSGESGVSFEVDLEKALPNGHYRGHMIANTRHEILRLPFADSTPRVHHIVFDQNHPLVRIVSKGDSIALYPKAMFPGWMNHIYSAEIHAVTEH